MEKYNYQVYNYKEINVGKFSGTRHFELVHYDCEHSRFSDKVNISLDRGFAKSNPDYWVKEHDGKKWKKNCLSGMFKTKTPNIYFGDIKRDKTLLLFEFLDNSHELNIYTFEDYHKSDVEHIINYIFKE